MPHRLGLVLALTLTGIIGAIGCVVAVREGGPDRTPAVDRGEDSRHEEQAVDLDTPMQTLDPIASAPLRTAPEGMPSDSWQGPEVRGRIVDAVTGEGLSALIEFPVADSKQTALTSRITGQFRVQLDKFADRYLVRAPGYAEFEGRLSEVEAFVDVGSIALDPDDHIDGRVVDIAGRPVEGASVCVIRRWPMSHEVEGAVSNNDGRFRLPWAEVGFVRAIRLGDSSEWTLVATGGGETLELQLRPAATLHFEVNQELEGGAATAIQVEVRTAAVPLSLSMQLEASEPETRSLVVPPGKATISLRDSPLWRLSAGSTTDGGASAGRAVSLELEAGSLAVVNVSHETAAAIRCVGGDRSQTVDNFRAQLGSMETFASGRPSQWFDYEWVESRGGQIFASELGRALYGESELRLTIEAPGYQQVSVDHSIVEQLRAGNNVVVPLQGLDLCAATFVRRGQRLKGLELELRSIGGQRLIASCSLGLHGETRIPVASAPFEVWSSASNHQGLEGARGPLAAVVPADIEQLSGREVVVHLDRTGRVQVSDGCELATELVLVGETSGQIPLQTVGSDAVFPVVPPGRYFLGHLDEAQSVSARAFWGEQPWWLSVSAGEEVLVSLQQLGSMGGPSRDVILDVDGIDPRELVVQPIWSVQPTRVAFSPGSSILPVDDTGRVRWGRRGPVPPNLLVGRFGSEGFVPLAFGPSDRGIAVRVADVALELGESLGGHVSIEVVPDLGDLMALDAIELRARGGDRVELGAIPVGTASMRLTTSEGARAVALDLTAGRRTVLTILE